MVGGPTESSSPGLGTASRAIPTALPSRLVLFDGTCGLCDRSVQWMLEHDAEHVLRYAPLQGETAGRLRQCWRDEFPEGLESVVLVDSTGEETVVLTRSRAVLAILEALGATPWRLRILRLIPRPLLDLAYRGIARLRYRVFGQYDACRMPSAEERDLFLA